MGGRRQTLKTQGFAHGTDSRRFLLWADDSPLPSWKEDETEERFWKWRLTLNSPFPSL